MAAAFYFSTNAVAANGTARSPSRDSSMISVPLAGELARWCRETGRRRVRSATIAAIERAGRSDAPAARSLQGQRAAAPAASRAIDVDAASGRERSRRSRSPASAARPAHARPRLRARRRGRPDRSSRSRRRRRSMTAARIMTRIDAGDDAEEARSGRRAPCGRSAAARLPCVVARLSCHPPARVRGNCRRPAPLAAGYRRRRMEGDRRSRRAAKST